MEEFSELFITMCEKASDLHRVWIPTVWDYCFNKETLRSCQITSVLTKEDKEEMRKNYFWLPNLYLKGREEVEKKSFPKIVAAGEEYFHADMDAGTIEKYEKGIEVLNLQRTMYVFFRKKWNQKTQEWIDI